MYRCIRPASSAFGDVDGRSVLENAASVKPGRGIYEAIPPASTAVSRL